MAAVFGLVLGCGGPAWAHDPGLSTVQGEWSANTLALTTGMAPADADQLLPAGARSGEAWSSSEFDAARSHLVALAPTLWEVRSGSTLLVPREARVELLPGDNVSFFLLYAPAPGTERLQLRAALLPRLPAGHRQFVIIADARGSTIAKKLLSARDHELEVAVGPASASAPAAAGGKQTRTEEEAQNDDLATVTGFVKLGVEHIWTGYDHLLFLFALLVVCRSFKSIVAIVTCFTLAHSLTLALATLGVVHLPSRWVEPLIAASIVFVGVENLLRREKEPPGRWALTFGFGLIHGFGFASVLRDLGVGAGGKGLLLPLFTFNLGVELGQIVVAALVLPLLWRLRKNEAFVARGVPALSAVVAITGLYWLLQRTVFA